MRIHNRVCYNIIKYNIIQVFYFSISFYYLHISNLNYLFIIINIYFNIFKIKMLYYAQVNDLQYTFQI